MNRRVNLLKPRAGIHVTPQEIAALKIANDTNHRRNTTLPKANMNYRSEVRKADVTTLGDSE